jgi:hypothetical protein
LRKLRGVKGLRDTVLKRRHAMAADVAERIQDALARNANVEAQGVARLRRRRPGGSGGRSG